MSYKDLLKIANIVDNETRLREYAKFYRVLEINGFHYVNFNASLNNLSISNPNHTTHHEATSYLLFKKANYSINTARRQAYDLKKFLDFLYIWDIDLLNGDLYIIILGFIDYLRSIQSRNDDIPKSIYWSFYTKVPLHRQALTLGKVVALECDREGFMSNEKWNELSFTTIKQVVSTAIQFLAFLKVRTITYNEINLNQLPTKAKYKSTLLSGTLGDHLVVMTDIKGMLRTAGLKAHKHKINLLLRQKVFTIEELDTFMNFIPSDHYQNKFLFYVLKCFGLRASEAANIMIDTRNIPRNFITMEHFKAKEFLKNNLRGDIEYSKHINKWVCYVIKRENIDFRSQHKSGSREIPLLFSEDLFLELLTNAIKEREILIRYAIKKHSFLFVSRHNSHKGNPINGKTIGSRYTYYANALKDSTQIDLTKFSPHSLRHFFSTYLLRIKKVDISDVSRWLGHSSVEITRDTYSHFIPTEEDNKEVIKDMSNEFAKRRY